MIDAVGGRGVFFFFLRGRTETESKKKKKKTQPSFFFCSRFFSFSLSLSREARRRCCSREPREKRGGREQNLSPLTPPPPPLDSPNRPRPGLHDVRPLSLGDPDLHARRVQVRALGGFSICFFFPSCDCKLSRSFSFLSLCSLSKKPMGAPHRRYLDLPSVVFLSSTPERRDLDAIYVTRWRRRRKKSFEVVKLGAKG